MMNSDEKTLLQLILKPTQGQVVYTLFGTIGYFIYIYLSLNVFELSQIAPSLEQLFVELSATLLASNLIVIGNRYFSFRFMAHVPASARFNVRMNVFTYCIQILWAFFIANSIYLFEGYFTSKGDFIKDALATNILTMPFALIYYAIEHAVEITNEYKRQSINFEKLEKEKLDTELQLLRAQFNPHFIFNAINSIYFQIGTEKLAGQNILPRFKSMLKYLTEWCSQDFVPLEKEIDYIRNFIDIQMERKGETIQLQMDLDETGKRYTISPFLLQPFLENAFKYASGEMFLQVNLRVSQNRLMYTVINSVDTQYLKLIERKGVGLQNLTKRLELLYPAQHFIKCGPKGSIFVAEMQIELQSV